MSILVCAATAFEIEPTLSLITQNKINEKVVTLVTGVGLTAATYQLTKQVLVNRPKLIIQAGLAGSFNADLPILKTVVVKNESLGDLGVLENNRFKNIFELGFEEKNKLPWTEGKLLNTHEAILKLTDLPIVNAVTVQQITTDRILIDHYKNELGAQIETMEGAALHFVALMENIPFIQIRCISNFVGERDKQNWKIQESIRQLNLELQRLLVKL